MKPPTELQTLKAGFFRALAHPVRIRLLEVLVASGDTSVQELQRTLDIGQPIVSQQLARLRAHGIVVGRKRGSVTMYGAADPLIADLLRVARQILNRRLIGMQSMLLELKNDQPAGVRALTSRASAESSTARAAARRSRPGTGDSATRARR